MWEVKCIVLHYTGIDGQADKVVYKEALKL
jgi:hypothetical protein